MKSSMFQFYFSDIRSTGAAEEIDGKKKNLKKFYVRHCRLQVTCTVAEKGLASDYKPVDPLLKSQSHR